MGYNKYMDRRTAITLGAILIVLAGAFSYLIFNTDARRAMQRAAEVSNSQPANSQQVAPAQASSTAEAGKYVDYSDKALAEAKGSKIIFFHASWCPQCRSLEADINKKGVPSGVTILKADYDSSQELRQKYGVTIQTTVVHVDDNGNLIKKYVAYDDPTLDSVIKNVL